MSLAAVGCGDDDTTDTGGSGGSGGSSGKSGSGGAAGKTGGTGGSAGKSGSGGGGSGGSVSPDTCISDTTTVFKGQTGAPSAECISCICNENAKATEACNAMAKNCWGLIQCYDAHGCMPGSDEASCVTNNCGDFTGGITPAQGLSPTLTGDKCSAKCVPAGTDAGVDAGN